MTKCSVVFLQGYTVNNTFFNDAKAGDEYSLKAVAIDCSNDFYATEADFNEDVEGKHITFEDWTGKWQISAVLFEMVKDEDKIHHTGMNKQDTEEARLQKIEDERRAELAKRADARKKKREKNKPDDVKS